MAEQPVIRRRTRIEDLAREAAQARDQMGKGALVLVVLLLAGLTLMLALSGGGAHHLMGAIG
jgi:hypothetical protein